MPTIKIFWEWPDAFSKWGFDDGDGLVMTGVVADFIESQGYEVDYGLISSIHNTTIDSVKNADGYDYLDPDGTGGMLDPRYEDPRQYLPAELVSALDAYFDEDWEEGKPYPGDAAPVTPPGVD